MRASSFPAREREREREAKLYCKSIQLGHSNGIAADYKFKCKPTWLWSDENDGPTSLYFPTTIVGSSSRKKLLSVDRVKFETDAKIFMEPDVSGIIADFVNIFRKIFSGDFFFFFKRKID